MTASQLFARLPPMDLHQRVLFQQFCLLLAKHMYEMRLNNDARILDATDIKYLLVELADAIAPVVPCVQPQPRYQGTK